VSLAGLEALMEAAKRDLVSLEALLLAMLERTKGHPVGVLFRIVRMEKRERERKTRGGGGV
jgi:hypothetical protein